MRRLCLILIAAVFFAGWGVPRGLALDSSDNSGDTLSAYLHGRRLPLVEARMISDEGGRSVLLYGFVATEYGKRDAEDQARDFLDDPDIPITNRIKVRPELLTLGTGNNNSEAEPPPAASADTTNPGADQEQAAAIPADADLPETLGSRDDYVNQERDELLLSGGAGSAGVPVILAILGSGSIMPPIAPPIVFGPTIPYYLPPLANRPSVIYPPGVIYPPRVIYPPPAVALGHSPGPGFAGFPYGRGYNPSPFPAGPAPTFPATGGMPPFPSAVGPGFGGFSRPGFSPGFGASPGFSRGFGFGGHR